MPCVSFIFIKKLMKFFTKTTLVIFLLILSKVQVFAQLPRNEKGKIEFTEIIKDSITPSILLLGNGQRWMEKNFKNKEMSITQDSNATNIKSEGAFLVYNKGIVSKEPHGRIRFSVQLDVKANKYRYSFTNFVFEYFKINREYKFTASGKEKPLEDPKASGWQKLWNKHKGTTNVQIQNYIAALKNSMQQNASVKKPEVKKEEW